MRQDIAALEARLARAAPEGDSELVIGQPTGVIANEMSHVGDDHGEEPTNGLFNLLALIAPELVLTGMGMLLLLIAAWGGDAQAQLNTYLAGIGLFASAGMLLVPTLHDGLVGADTSAFGDLMRADAFSAFTKSLIYLGSIGCLLVAPSYFSRLNAMRAEYPVLIVFASLGMSIMVSVADFLTLYLGLELNSLAAYVLASILRTDDKSAEAGLKYFVLGALASGILLYGMSLVYGFTGSTSFVGVSAAFWRTFHRCIVRNRVCPGGPCIQGFRCTIPHVDT